MGCTQNYLAPKFTFTAIFLDAFTNQPIEGFEVARLDAVETKGIFNGGRTTLISNIPYSNKEGTVLFSFHRFRKADSYELLFYSPDKKYFEPVNENVQATEYDTFKNIKKTYKLNSRAQLRLKVNIKTPLKDGESIRLLVAAEYEIIITNKYVHEDKIYLLRGNIPLNYTKIYKINGVETRVREILTLKPFVVNDYEFTY